MGNSYGNALLNLLCFETCRTNRILLAILFAHDEELSRKARQKYEVERMAILKHIADIFPPDGLMGGIFQKMAT